MKRGIFLSGGCVILLLARCAGDHSTAGSQRTDGPPAETELSQVVPPPSGANETAGLLVAGHVHDAQRRLEQQLTTNPEDDQARFEAAVVRFLRGLEELGRALYRYAPRTRQIPGLGVAGTRLPLPPNDRPEEISYEKLRDMLENWSAALRETADLLDGLGDGEVKLALPVGLVRLDFDGDGAGTEDESLWQIYEAFNPRPASIGPVDAACFIVSFDRADAEWLHGYCHLLLALDDIVLAHDFRELFERTAHLFFPRIETPHRFLSQIEPHLGFDFEGMIDIIAYAHLLNFPVSDPARLSRAREHLLTTIASSRRMWQFAQAETDDDHEWIPNPRQSSPLLTMSVTQEQVNGWHEFLDELEALLTGQKLAPFWREGDSRGVNIMRAFTESRQLDVVLWLQGTAATPYLEEGPKSEAAFWQRLQRVFDGGFLNFAIWWN